MSSEHAGLLEALERLDRLLARAIAHAEHAYGPASDPFRGLHLGPGDVERLLARAPGHPVLGTDGKPTGAGGERLDAFVGENGLAPFEVDALLIALAPDIDLRYERLYAYLQDDMTMRRPSVDLALNLLCASAEEKIARRATFHADAPLISNGIVRLEGDATAPLLRKVLAVDDQVIRRLLGTGGLDARLAPFCELVGDSAPALPGGPQPHVYFRGRPASGRRRAGQMLADSMHRPLLVADLARLPDAAARILVREAALHGALLYLDGAEALAERQSTLATLVDELARHELPVAFAGERSWSAPPRVASRLGIHTVLLDTPSARQRREFWDDELGPVGATTAQERDTLAHRFRLTAGQIRAAAADARQSARWRGGSEPSLTDLFATARAQTGHALTGLAMKIESGQGWDDIVLPDDSERQLRELCARVVHREHVLTVWGFARKLALGRGVTALFAGPPGTGKTMAAGIVASELGLDLYRIDLSGVVSKWIGETEKNLDRIFAAAEDANSILFFDEADALFGKRSEVREAHDRYANVEISYLLQKMEEYDGVAILATNRIDNLDEAFLRRIAYVVRFPFPEAEERLRIWAGVWPEQTPLAEDVEWRSLAEDLEFSGAEIKNVALAAAFLAAGDGSPVTAAHVRHAVRREYEKTGKSFTDAELR
jgi:hypothetical protein